MWNYIVTSSLLFHCTFRKYPWHDGLVTRATQLPFISAMKDFFRLREEMWCVVRRVGSWAARQQGGDKLLQLMGASIERELRTY